MFKNKTADGKSNLCGPKVRILRKQMRLSQRALADKLQLEGIDLGKNAIQQIEKGNRFVTDIEIKALSGLFGITLDELLK